MRVNQMAREIGVTGDTVRYYTRIGFLKPAKNPSNGYKEYGPRDRRLLRFILSARQLGFSVNDIGEILHPADQGVSPCPLTRRLIQQRLEENEKNLSGYCTVAATYAQRRRGLESKADQAPTGDMICHLIEEFDNAAL